MKNSMDSNADDLQMDYFEYQFTDEIKTLIDSTEKDFLQHCEALLNEYKPVFAKRNQVIHIDVMKNSTELFSPGHRSFVLIEIKVPFENYNKLIEIPIWNCQRSFLGIPLAINLPGSKITGTLNTLKNTKDVFKEFIEDNLKKE